MKQLPPKRNPGIVKKATEDDNPRSFEVFRWIYSDINALIDAVAEIQEIEAGRQLGIENLSKAIESGEIDVTTKRYTITEIRDKYNYWLRFNEFMPASKGHSFCEWLEKHP